MYMYWKKVMQMQDYITKDLQEIGRNVVYWVYLGGGPVAGFCRHGTEHNSICPPQYTIYHWSKVFLQTLTAPKTIQKLTTFYGTRTSSRWSQQPATCSYSRFVSDNKILAPASLKSAGPYPSHHDEWTAFPFISVHVSTTYSWDLIKLLSKFLRIHVSKQRSDDDACSATNLHRQRWMI